MKNSKDKIEYNSYSPKIPKSHSVDEILRLGGAAAFADKFGKNAKDLVEKLTSLPQDSFLTDEEFISALAILNENK